MSNYIPKDLLRKWRKDFKEGRSSLNPDCKDFLKVYEYLEIYLYNAHSRSRTKSLVKIDGTDDAIIGHLLSTKKENQVIKKENLNLFSKGFYDKNVNQYIEVFPRNKDRHGKNITTNKALKRKRKELTLAQKKKIKKALDNYKKKKPI